MRGSGENQLLFLFFIYTHMAEENNKPVLYSFYDKQYNYNDLARSADAGLNTYLSKLKRGEKDADEFRTAYSNIMSGIKDGTITYREGRFYDSKGRYSGSKKENKDYYGLMANYILGHMNRMDEYVQPKAKTDPGKIAWGSNSMRTALNRAIYGHDSGNIQDFLDLDEEKDGMRGIQNRSAYLAKQFHNIIDNWDNTFQGYTDEDKARSINLLSAAAQALEDGTINAGDYLALNKAVGGVDFRSLLSTEGTKKDEKTTPEKPVTRAFMTRSLSSVKPSDSTVAALSATLGKQSSSELIKYIRASLLRGDYSAGKDPVIKEMFNNADLSDDAVLTAVLNSLQKQNYLKKAGENVYYIPGTRRSDSKDRGWFWDMDNNTLKQYNMSDLFTNYTTSKKKGGVILKGKNGLPVARIPLLQGDADITDWIIRGINDKGEYIDRYQNGASGNNNDFYTPDTTATGKGMDYAKAVEEQSLYKSGTDLLKKAMQSYLDNEESGSDKPSNLTWFLEYDKSLPEGRKSRSFFDENGKLRSSWTISGKDATGRDVSKTFDNVLDYLDYIRTDGIVGATHNNPVGSGTRYYRLNGEKREYLDPVYVQEYKDSYTLGDGESVRDGNTTWTDYLVSDKETAGTQQETEASQENGTGSVINTREAQTEESEPSSFLKDAVNMPKIAAARRVFDSINTNNRITEVLRKSMRPVLLDTYELYSPVTGAFSEMQFRNKQAADVRRQAARHGTSDASLSIAAMLDAGRQADELEYKGYLADDEEIKRTRAEALQRQENNAARRMAVANENSKALNANNRELANLEAVRLNKNYTSRDNFNKDIEAELKDNWNYKKLIKRENELNKDKLVASQNLAPFVNLHSLQKKMLENYYNNNILALEDKNDANIAAFKAANGNNKDYTGESWYKDYLKEKQKIFEERSRNVYEMSLDQGNQLKGVYSIIWNNPGSRLNLDATNMGPDVSDRDWYKIINMEKWIPKQNS